MILHHQPISANILLEVERGQLKVTRGNAGKPRATPVKIGIGINDLVRDHARLQNFLATIDIAQEEIPGPHALGQAPLDSRPFVAANHQRHQVESTRGSCLLRRDFPWRQVRTLLLAQFLRHGKNAIELLEGQGTQRLLNLARNATRGGIRPEALRLPLAAHSRTIEGRGKRGGRHSLPDCPTALCHARA